MQLLEFRSSVQKVEYYDCYPINLKYMELLQHAKHDDIKSMETANRQHLKMPNDRYASHSMVLHTREKRLNMHCDRVIISFRSTNCVVPFDVSCICTRACTHWSLLVTIGQALLAQVISCYFHARQKLDSN